MGRYLRLASYNIQKAVGLDFRRDPGRILEVINGLGADIVALQEVDKRPGQIGVIEADLRGVITSNKGRDRHLSGGRCARPCARPLGAGAEPGRDARRGQPD